MGRFVKGTVVVVNYFFTDINILNTVDSSRILYSMGKLSVNKMKELTSKIGEIIGT